MKVPIKREFFDAIGRGHKNREWRDAHITFVCEETGRTNTKYIKEVRLVEYKDIPESIRKLNEKQHFLEDATIMEIIFD